ncbi:ABC transporter permease [Streptococcus danieliae]|uniref:ABC transporter permease n=1 Tax=Streptococcus danieliae TaxID=747656 RepID=A0A7X3G925_9STRE|nr:ABC transporter permease [Streptococcus danieliae]MVX59368.1 ABC transporter permease [Streptococcus danieliae]
MNHRLKSLLWLRWQFLQSNKFIVFVFVLSPYIDTYLLRIFDEIAGGTGTERNLGILISAFVLGAFAYGHTVVLTSLIVAEEKQKRNIRTLSIAGVTAREYLISVALIPFLSAIPLASLAPLVFGLPVTNWFVYLILLCLTLVAYLCLGLVIGLLTKNSGQAASISILLIFLSMGLPLLYDIYSWLQLPTDLSLMGATVSFLVTGYVQLVSVIALLGWLILFAALAFWAYEKNRKEER